MVGGGAREAVVVGFIHGVLCLFSGVAYGGDFCLQGGAVSLVKKKKHKSQNLIIRDQNQQVKSLHSGI